MSDPNIYEYTDFRVYLADWQASRQKRDPRFTKTVVSHSLGLPRTRGFFTDILSGKKLTETFLERFCELLDLPRDQERFFRALVRFNQAETPEDKELALDQLDSLRRTTTSTIQDDSREYYRHWWHGAIRALLSARDLNETGLRKAVAEFAPPLTPGQARHSLDLLRKLGLVEVRDGFWKPTAAALATPEYAKDEIYRMLQAQQLELARQALLSPGDGNRAIATNIVSLSATAWERLRERLDKFRSEVRGIAVSDSEPADRVALVAHILLPLHEAPR